MRSRSRETASRTRSGSESYRGRPRISATVKRRRAGSSWLGLVGVGNDGDRDGGAGFHPPEGHELADRAQLPGEFPDARLAGVARTTFPPDSGIRHVDPGHRQRGSVRGRTGLGPHRDRRRLLDHLSRQPPAGRHRAARPVPNRPGGGPGRTPQRPSALRAVEVNRPLARNRRMPRLDRQPPGTRPLPARAQPSTGPWRRDQAARGQELSDARLDLRPPGIRRFELPHRRFDVAPLGRPRGPRQGRHHPHTPERRGGGLLARSLRQADLVEHAGQNRDRQLDGLEPLDHLLGEGRHAPPPSSAGSLPPGSPSRSGVTSRRRRPSIPAADGFQVRAADRSSGPINASIDRSRPSMRVCRQSSLNAGRNPAARIAGLLHRGRGGGTARVVIEQEIERLGEVHHRDGAGPPPPRPAPRRRRRRRPPRSSDRAGPTRAAARRWSGRSVRRPARRPPRCRVFDEALGSR